MSMLSELARPCTVPMYVLLINDGYCFTEHKQYLLHIKRAREVEKYGILQEESG